MEFNKAMERVKRWEGGYVNDPDDPGGETNFGITKKIYPQLDIKNLTFEDAKKIYYRDYWLKNNVHLLPEKYKLIYFDMCINMGPYGATIVIQEAINWKLLHKLLKEDGQLGPLTLSAIYNHKPEIDRIRAHRVNYYAKIIDKSPSLTKFFLGWFRRAIDI